jgi:hypothetical protein
MFWNITKNMEFKIVDDTIYFVHEYVQVQRAHKNRCSDL